MNKLGVIPILADILSDFVKEKVTRISWLYSGYPGKYNQQTGELYLQVLQVTENFYIRSTPAKSNMLPENCHKSNLIEKPEESNIAKENCIAMVQSKVFKQLSILEQCKFDDGDIVEDVQFLNEKLQASVQDLSSFDEYATEVKFGRLEWSPVHRSAQFWRENAAHLNEHNYELLCCLVHLLDNSKDALVLSVESFDVGGYVRHYPQGKHVIEQLGGKQLVMQLLSHKDSNVRYEALLAVQK